MYYVYLLKSLKDNNYYIGQTDNIERRFNQHNKGQNKSTKNRKPFILLGFEKHETRNEARFREHELKKHSDKKRKFIQNILTNKEDE